MKTQNQLDRKTIKYIAEVFNELDDAQKMVSNGLDLSKCEYGEIIPDGYTLLHAERLNLIDEHGFKKFAKSLRIRNLIKTSAEGIQTLLGLSKAKVKRNDVFIAIETKNDDSQVVIVWKYC